MIRNSRSAIDPVLVCLVAFVDEIYQTVCAPRMRIGCVLPSSPVICTLGRFSGKISFVKNAHHFHRLASLRSRVVHVSAFAVSFVTPRGTDLTRTTRTMQCLSSPNMVRAFAADTERPRAISRKRLLTDFPPPESLANHPHDPTLTAHPCPRCAFPLPLPPRWAFPMTSSTAGPESTGRCTVGTGTSRRTNERRITSSLFRGSTRSSRLELERTGSSLRTSTYWVASRFSLI